MEFRGDGIARLRIPDRFTLCNMMAETVAKCALMPCDMATEEYLGPAECQERVASDEGAVYARSLFVDVSSLEPMVALPHRTDDVVPLSQVSGLPVGMGLLGTCTNGRMEDFVEALEVMGEAVLARFPADRCPRPQDLRRGPARDAAQFAAKGAMICPFRAAPVRGAPGPRRRGQRDIHGKHELHSRMGTWPLNILWPLPRPWRPPP